MNTTELDRLRLENENMRKALNKINNLCQTTNMSFETQSFEAEKISREALTSDRNEQPIK